MNWGRDGGSEYFDPLNLSSLLALYFVAREYDVSVDALLILSGDQDKFATGESEIRILGFYDNEESFEVTVKHLTHSRDFVIKESED